jgi:hypothetical protein
VQKAQANRFAGQAGEKPLESRLVFRTNGTQQQLLIIGQAKAWLPFYATIITERTVYQYQADVTVLYRALLEAALPYLAGETEKPPVPIDVLIEPELCALAARRSWLEGDRVVSIDELTNADAGYDGQAFAQRYREAKLGG